MAQPVPKFWSILGLDVGGKRIGVALANNIARLASPLDTLTNDDHFVSKLKRLIDEHTVKVLVIGLPRGLEGQDTAQTREVVAFSEKLKDLGPEIRFQDEALTSHLAESELAARDKIYQKSEVDSLAATYILEDYLKDFKT